MSAFDYSITYHLNSNLQDNSKFICNYKAEINVLKSSGHTLKVGRFNFTIVLINQIKQSEHNLLDVLKEQEDIIASCEHFIHIENGEFRKELSDTKPGNICLVRDFDLLPGFRGKDLGNKVLQDFNHRFKSMFSLLVIDAIPFQISAIHQKRKQNGKLDDFSEAMGFEDGVFDEETAKLKLFAFFQKFGFVYFKDNLFYKNTN